MLDFSNITNSDLFHTVFDNEGQVRACGRDACIELIQRLEVTTGCQYGDNAGRLELPEAYEQGKLLFL